MGFCLPGSRRLGTVVHGFDDGPPYERLEQAVPRILDEVLTMDFPDAPERSTRLQQAIRASVGPTYLPPASEGTG
jgi:hypothetical protein